MACCLCTAGCGRQAQSGSTFGYAAALIVLLICRQVWARGVENSSADEDLDSKSKQEHRLSQFKSANPHSPLIHHAGTFGRMESNTAALMKILDSLEKQERMVKTMLEDRKRQLRGNGAKAHPGLAQLTASTAQVREHAVQPKAACIS